MDFEVNLPNTWKLMEDTGSMKVIIILIIYLQKKVGLSIK